MDFRAITAADERWDAVKAYAEKCSWRAGKALAARMDDGGFADWERVIVALDRETICGFCTVSQTDCLPNAAYTPYISFLFVDEAYRGQRLSEQMIRYAEAYLHSVGFCEVYLVSDHVNLYEKYGFQVVDRQMAPWGEEEKIYHQTIG